MVWVERGRQNYMPVITLARKMGKCGRQDRTGERLTIILSFMLIGNI